MNLKSYVKKVFNEQGMKISDDGTEAIIQCIENYVTDITNETINLHMHKTLMGDDVAFVLRMKEFRGL